jgi:hypothetical protein
MNSEQVNRIRDNYINHLEDILKNGVKFIDKNGEEHLRPPNAAELKRIQELLESAGVLQQVSGMDKLVQAAAEKARTGALKFKDKIITTPVDDPASDVG